MAKPKERRVRVNSHVVLDDGALTDIDPELKTSVVFRGVIDLSGVHRDYTAEGLVETVVGKLTAFTVLELVEKPKDAELPFEDEAAEALVGEAFPEPSEDDGPFDAISTGDPVPAAVDA